MGIPEPKIIHTEPLYGDLTRFEIGGACEHEIDIAKLPPEADRTDMEDPKLIEELAESLGREIVIVGAALFPDTHTSGLDAILNLKGYNGHKGLEGYQCFTVYNLGSQVPNAELVAKAEEVKADVILVSATVTQRKLHQPVLEELAEMAPEGTTVLIAGGIEITDKEAKELGFDAGFGRGTLPEHVATYIVHVMCERRVDLVHAAAATKLLRNIPANLDASRVPVLAHRRGT